MTTTESGVPAFDEVQARDLASALVEAARRAGASWCDAAVSFGSALAAVAREGELEKVARDTWRAAGVRVVVDGRLGLASAADAPLTRAAIDELARQAVALARAASVRDDNAEPEPVGADGAALSAVPLALWDEATANATPAWAAAEALALDRVLRGHEGVAATQSASATARRGTFALATSWGFVGSHRATWAMLSVSGVLEEGGGKKQVEGEWDGRRALSALRPAEAIARDAAAQILARAGARKLESTRLPVIFAPEIARGFVGSVLACACGDAVALGRSFLKDKVGERVWIKGARLVDDPLLVGGAATRSFDGEGTPAARREIVDVDGVLRTYLLDHRSARQLGLRTTGHATRGARGLPSPSFTNVLVEGGAGDLASIVADTPRGLLVTKAMGRTLDPVSGEVSRGVAGFLVEGGERAYPVEEITIAGQALEMMQQIDRVGADADTRGAVRAPTLRFEALPIAGK